MVTACEIILRCRSKALPLMRKSATYHGNLRWGACIVVSIVPGFFITEKLNQAQLILTGRLSPSFDRGWKRENDTY